MYISQRTQTFADYPRTLQYADPNTFASLILLNRKWRHVSQKVQLYAHQLSRCPSYAASHPPIPIPLPDAQLPVLRRAFAHEVKRNLFDAYLRPRETLVKLVSTSISSSAAIPGGEAFHFAFSQNGQYVLAYSTSRIHVLHVADSELSVERELKILRRPASLAILDDGTRLAVLSSDHQVDLYDLSDEKPKHLRAISLDYHPRTISLSPCGSVLAAAYDGGIEVYSLRERALATKKRAVKCDAADHLSFSRDGTQLLGTTINSKTPSTVVLTAPYFNPGEQAPEDTISQLWTTSILFPNRSRDCSHALLLPNHGYYEVNWTFAFDRIFETFRAVRIDDLRNGTTYFAGPLAPAGSILLPSTLPSSTISGEIVVSGFDGRDIWCYGIPESLDPPNVASSATAASTVDDLKPSAQLPIAKDSALVPALGGSHTRPKESKESSKMAWQNLDRLRNTLVQGHKVGSLEGVTGLRWIATSPKAPCERLIAAAPGGVGQTQGLNFDMDDDGMGAMDGGRLLILDFRYSTMNGQKSSITIEVGEKEPDVLEEEHRDLEAEVAIVRRRTVAQSRLLQQVVGRAARHRDDPRGFARSDAVPHLPRTPSTRKVALPSMEERSETSSIVSVDEQEALDMPYALGAPRSGTTLRRAATAAAVNRAIHPERRGPDGRPIERAAAPCMRDPTGHGELPHESDADNWVPPPPPYSKEPVPPLPEHLRNAISGGGIRMSPVALRRSSTARTTASQESDVPLDLHRCRSTYAASGRSPPVSPPVVFTGSVSDPSAVSAGSSGTPNNEASVPAPAENEFDDLYDVSPQRTPEPQNAVPVLISAAAQPHSLNHILRRPVPPPQLISESAPKTTIVNERTAQTISPRPRHAVLNTVQNISNGLSEIRHPPNVTAAAAPSPTLSNSARRVSGGEIPTQRRPDTDLPPPPNDDHRITDLPPQSPAVSMASYERLTQTQPAAPVASEQRPANTAPAAIGHDIGEVSGPSASQLNRLNSRSGRPKSFVDPERRSSGNFGQHVPDLSQLGHGQPLPQPQQPPLHSVSPATPIQNDPSRAAAGAYRVPLPPVPLYPSYQDMQNSFGRGRGGSDATFIETGYRPPISRLETIHSVASTGDAAAHLANSVRPTIVGVSRQTSRAERSAAINIQEAKRRGWRGSTKKKKKEKMRKGEDGASGAGWTDVSPLDESVKPKKVASKCKVM